MFKQACDKAAASEEATRTVLGTWSPSERCENAVAGFVSTSYRAEVVEWQTRTFEGRVAQAVRVQVPPSAPIPLGACRAAFKV